MIIRFSLDAAHLLAGGMVLVSFMMLYQNRILGLLNVFAAHAVVLALSVAWQAYIQHAPHLYVTAALALILKAALIPLALHRMVLRLGVHRTIETVGGIGLTMLMGMMLVALSMVVIASMIFCFATGSPASTRFASSTSSSGPRSGTLPISRRYMRTGSVRGISSSLPGSPSRDG